jgi:hypothetical protein
LLLSLLLQCILGDRLERLLDVDGLLCRSLEIRDVAFRLAPGHCAFLCYLNSERVSGCGYNSAVRVAYLSLALFHVDLVPENNKGEVLGVMWARLDQKLVSPTVQGLERL